MSRLTYLLRRVVLAGPVGIAATSLAFLIIRAGPTDPVLAIVGQGSARAAYHRVAVRLGIERPSGEPVPLWEQYLDFMGDLLALQFGQSWVVSPNTPVVEVIATRAPQTLWLGFWAVVVALCIGIPLGFYAGLHPNTPADYAASFGGIVWRAMPNFWLAVVLASLLTRSGSLVGFDWTTFLVETNVVTSPDLSPSALLTPRGFLAAFKQTLPAALVLGSASMGNEMRIGRTAVLETKHEGYVEAARARGLSERSIVWKHVFRNALLPLVPVITVEVFLLVGGAVLVEYVFAIDGIGMLYYKAVTQGDLPLAGALTFVFICVTLAVNIAQDVLYTIIDPRVTHER